MERTFGVVQSRKFSSELRWIDDGEDLGGGNVIWKWIPRKKFRSVGRRHEQSRWNIIAKYCNIHRHDGGRISRRRQRNSIVMNIYFFFLPLSEILPHSSVQLSVSTVKSLITAFIARHDAINLQLGTSTSSLPFPKSCSFIRSLPDHEFVSTLSQSPSRRQAVNCELLFWIRPLFNASTSGFCDRSSLFLPLFLSFWLPTPLSAIDHSFAKLFNGRIKQQQQLVGGPNRNWTFLILEKLWRRLVGLQSDVSKWSLHPKSSHPFR